MGGSARAAGELRAAATERRDGWGDADQGFVRRADFTLGYSRVLPAGRRDGPWGRWLASAVSHPCRKVRGMDDLHDSVGSLDLSKLVAAKRPRSSGGKEPSMMIIGCDFHPRFQQISFLLEETGECGQRRLMHTAEAEQYYAHSAGRRCEWASRPREAMAGFDAC